MRQTTGLPSLHITAGGQGIAPTILKSVQIQWSKCCKWQKRGAQEQFAGGLDLPVDPGPDPCLLPCEGKVVLVTHGAAL